MSQEQQKTQKKTQKKQKKKPRAITEMINGDALKNVQCSTGSVRASSMSSLQLAAQLAQP